MADAERLKTTYCPIVERVSELGSLDGDRLRRAANMLSCTDIPLDRA